VLYFQPAQRGTDLEGALRFLLRVTPHRAIAVIISDFIVPGPPRAEAANAHLAALKQSNRRHDVVAVQVSDPHEFELPPVGRLTLWDAETGEIVEVNARDHGTRQLFREQRAEAQRQLEKMFRSAGVDAIPLRTDQPYGVELARFFEQRERRRARG
jgi:uncharacterized protein (DUF58 family)